MLEDKLFDKKVILYGMLDDMYNIAEKNNENEVLQVKDKIIPENSSDLQNISNAIQNKTLLKTKVISTFLSKYNDRISQNTIRIYKSVLSSIKLLSENTTDSISNKNQISLLIFSYYMVAHFNFLLTEDIEPLRYFKEKIISNLGKIIEGGNLIKAVQNIINNTSTEIWIKNKKKENFVDILLNTAKNRNFESKYNDFISKQNEKKIKKNEKKKDKDKNRKIEKSDVVSTSGNPGYMAPEAIINKPHDQKKEESNNKIINLNNKEDEEDQKYNSIGYIKDEENEKKTKENSHKNQDENTQNPKNDPIEKISQKEKEDKFVLKDLDISLKESKIQDNDKNANKEIGLINNRKIEKEKEKMKCENDYPEKEIKEKEDKNKHKNSTNKQAADIIEGADEDSIKIKFKKHNDKIKKENTDNEFNKINAPENETKDKNTFSEKIINQINSVDIPNQLKLILKSFIDNIDNENLKMKKKITNLNEKITNLEKDKNDKDIAILNLNEKLTNLEKDKDIAINNLNEKINYLNEECKNLTDNQIIFTGYLNLLTNGRDISKSIVHFLYKYLKFKPKEGEQNYFHLSKIIEALDNNNYDKQAITIDKDILKKFLYLDFFLSKLFNNIIHREIKFKSPEANKKLRLIPEYTFNEKFTNLIFFINNTIKDSDIQIAIQETIDEYSSDSGIFDNIKYKEDNLFFKINGTYEPILKEKDIEDVKKFLLDIKIDNKKFDELCEKKDWKKYGKKGEEEKLITPQFFKGGEKLSDN